MHASKHRPFELIWRADVPVWHGDFTGGVYMGDVPTAVTGRIHNPDPDERDVVWLRFDPLDGSRPIFAHFIQRWPDSFDQSIDDHSEPGVRRERGNPWEQWSPAMCFAEKLAVLFSNARIRAAVLAAIDAGELGHDDAVDFAADPEAIPADLVPFESLRP